MPTPERAAGHSRPRVLFLNRSYWPDSEATGQLLTQLCEDLTDRFDVRVLAGQPNHVEESVEWSRSGRQTHNGVALHRVRHLQFPKRSTLGRVFNMCSFTLSAGLSTLFGKRPDVVVTETDPFLLPFVGLWIKIRHRCRLVIYLQDIYPDVAVAVGKVREGLLTRTLRRLLWGVYRRADRVVVLSEEMRQRCFRNGARLETCDIVPNWADTSVVHPVKSRNDFRRQHSLDGKFVVMYSGNLGLVHTLDPILEVAERLHESHPHVVFVFVGEGVRKPKLIEEVQDRHLTNVRFLPYQRWADLAHSLSAADVHLLSLRPEATDCVSPSKLYGILASGTPAVALIDPESSHGELIREQQVGFVCDVTEPDGGAERLAYVIDFLADRPDEIERLGENARRLAESRFDRRRQTSRFAQLLDEVLNPAAQPIPEPVDGLALMVDGQDNEPVDQPSTTNHQPNRVAIEQGP